MNRITLALSVYDSLMNIFHYYWDSIEDCYDKNKSHTRVKAYAIVEHDRVLLSTKGIK